MKFLLLTLTLAAGALLFLFCKHQPKFTADKLPEKQLRWGSGGGFVGKPTTHILLQNGQTFKRDITDAVTETAKTPSKSAAALFKTAESLGLAKLGFDHPGNIYNFIEWQDGDQVQRVVWGDGNYPVDAKVQALYDQLNALLK